ncbi:MAG TPA: hypothetical protein VGB30_13430 [bacterium]
MINKSNEILNSLNGSYSLRLSPFLVLSLAVHLVLIGGIYTVDRFFTGGQGISVHVFSPGDPRDVSQPEILHSGLSGDEILKIFRIDFFSQIIPWTPPEPEEPEPIGGVTPDEPEVSEVEPEPVEEIPEPEIIEEPELSVVETEPDIIPPVVEPDIPDDSLIPDIPDDYPDILPGENPGDTIPVPDNNQPVAMPVMPEGYSYSDTLPDNLGVFSDLESTDSGGDAFLLPEWHLDDIDGVEWSSDQYLGNYTIYVIGDISKRHGLDELLAWNWTLRNLITNPQAAFPPSVVSVVSALENPYAYNELRVKNTLHNARESENCYGPIIMDLEGEIPKSLSYTELPQPIVMFVDQYGYIRLIMIGRIRDISNENIKATMGVIADMWRWDDAEAATMPSIVTLLINILRDQANDETIRTQAPPSVAYEVDPSWGYPEPLSPDEN